MEPQLYRTTDRTLAASLMAKGFVMVKPMTFEDNETLQDFLTLYGKGKVAVNFRSFSEHYQYLRQFR